MCSKFFVLKFSQCLFDFFSIDFYCFRKIFDLVKERQTLWDRMNALEAKPSEPGRYNNRGGQLLKEEKERKMISKKLPIIEQELIELVQEYEARHTRKFTIHGEPLDEVIQRAWSRKEEAKELVKSARKNPAPPAFRTPLGKAPMSATKAPNSTLRSSSVKRFASNTNLTTMSASKRRLVIPERSNPVKRNILCELVPTNVSTATRSATKPKTPMKLPTFNVVKRRVCSPPHFLIILLIMVLFLVLYPVKSIECG